MKKDYYKSLVVIAVCDSCGEIWLITKDVDTRVFNVNNDLLVTCDNCGEKILVDY